MADLAPGQKLWIERDSRVVMSDYRLRLLELVRDTGSLAQAASAMKLSYRRAWGKVKEIEENLGYSLVESAVGGAGGGKTELTAAGRELVEAYGRFKERMGEALERAYAEEIAVISRPR